MARIKYIQSARASTKVRRCYTCQHEIAVGEPYKRISMKTGPRSSMKRYWCKSCTPKASQTTTNDRHARLYAIVENIEESGTLDDLRSALETGADEAEDIASEYEESADNMPESLQYGTQAEEMRDKASEIRDWADELRSTMDDLPDGDDCAECDEDRDAPIHDEENEEEFDHEFEEFDLTSVDIPSCPV